LLEEVKSKCASTLSQLGSGTEQSVATQTCYVPIGTICLDMRWELKIFWGNKHCLGQDKTLSRSKWLTGADLSDTLHEILDVHIFLLI